MDLYEEFEHAHLPRGVDGSGTIRLATFLEKQVRFASCLIMGALAQEESFQARLPRLTGLGGYLGFLRHCAEEIRAVGLDQGLAGLAAGIDASLSQQATLDRDGLSVKQFRDYVAHAGLVPGDGRFDRALKATVRENADLLSERIRLMGGTRLIDDSYFLGSIPLAPLFVHREGYPAMYQEINKKEVTYYSVAEDVLVYRVGLASSSNLRGILDLVTGNPDRDGAALRLFKDAIVEDLKGFAVPGSVQVSGIFAPFKVEWRWLTSSGSEQRVDTFRLGSRNEWQWQHGRSWKGYDSFLQTIANWLVVAQRSLTGLNSRIATWEAMENRLFEGALAMNVPATVESQLARRDVLSGSASTQHQGVTTLAGMLDDSAGQVMGRPTIYFITGEAGIGKTYSLMHLTSRRAEDLIDGATTMSPLYLYVSCSGTGLKRLKDLINAEVAETRNLVYESVMCMCRNGLLVLVVDGFDELIGGAGYRDAFDQLEPLLVDLGDRGTILLSARSAYLANQYRGSIELHAKSAGQQVRHEVFELQRWNESQVDDLFDANCHWHALREKLSKSDLALLGVPFFARAFNSYASSPEAGDQFVSLRQVLVDSYLERETSKLGRPGGERPLSRAQLSAVLEEIASELHYSGQGALSLDEFKLACAAGLNLDVDGRSASLLDRLTVLCGIAANRTADEGHQFAFEHDIFGEVFLGRYVARTYLDRSMEFGPRVVDWFGRDVLGSACIETMIALVEEAVIIRLIESISKDDLSKVDLAANLMSLISEAIRLNIGLPKVRVENATLDYLDLVADGRIDMRLDKCRVKLLRVGAHGGCYLGLRNVEVSQLEVVADDGDMRWVHIDETIDIGQMFVRSVSSGVSKFESDPHVIGSVLNKLGVRGVASEATVADSHKSYDRLFAESVLDDMDRKGDWRYVVGKGNLPGAIAGPGVKLPMDPAWARMTRALLASDLATLRSLNSSGVAKYWVTLKLGPSLILADEDQDSRVATFWKRL